MAQPVTELADRRIGFLRALEAEAIHIFRETVASFERPVMLYSIGKDSATLLHLARKAFAPGPLPFPLLHVDTTFKFREMIAFRDAFCAAEQLPLLIHRNPEAVSAGINPFDHGSQTHTRIWKTEGLLQALRLHRFDAAFGGARREEEKSRAKERIFSLRSADQAWDPRRQRPELWDLYNTHLGPGETMRIFPLSNWTELDIWSYIESEAIEIPSLYLASEREVVLRDGMLYAVNEFVALKSGERSELRSVRYRTMGDANLTAAVESTADTVAKVVAEIAAVRVTERGATRGDDKVSEAAMEDRKKEGYF